MTRTAASRLGAQLWLERDSSPDRIERLVSTAVESGLGLLRIFLVWPWIEPEPDVWDFDLYDVVFATADRYGVRIKATLGPDTPPWHVGTPGFVQSRHVTLPSTDEQRIALLRYLRTCVQRYREHPALAQWILWNEPANGVVPPGQPNPHRSELLRQRWAELLRRRYLDDLGGLNRRWHTGYKSFDEIPFPEDLPHPAHRSEVFFSFDPWLAEYELRAAALRDELAFVTSTIRELDEHTPVCLNPPDLYRNHAELGYDFTALASTADVLGASVHAPWHLGFSPRPRHVALVANAIRMLRQTPGAHEVELTEVQLGNVYYGSPRPYGISAAKVAASYLAPLLAGATSVTGWCLNSRRRDFEAGDWALLDDDDRPGERARASRRVDDLLGELEHHIGGWRPRPVDTMVLFSEHSQAVVLTHSWTSADLSGRGPNDPIQGAAQLAVELLRTGLVAAPTPVTALGENRTPPRLVVASQLTAYDESTARNILALVARGSTLVIDGTTGHKDLDAAVYRPWPGVFGTELGFGVRGLRTRPEGHPVSLFGLPAGRLPLVYADHEFRDPAWHADEQPQLSDEGGRPLVWRRGYGEGSVVVFAGPLGPAVVADLDTAAVARSVFHAAVGPDVAAVRPLSDDTFTFVVEGDSAEAIGVFGPEARERGGRPMLVRLPPGDYRDLWTAAAVVVDGHGMATLDSPDGIALLVPEPG